MVAYITREKEDILRQALTKLQEKTPVTAVGPGSVARALAESVIDEISNLYEVMDFNTSMVLLSTARGRALDMLGQLYNVERKTLTNIAALDQKIGSFYFYLDEPYDDDDIVVPSGTQVWTDSQSYIGRQFTYYTTGEAIIPRGRRRAFVDIRPSFSDSIFTTGPHTITEHNAPAPDGVELKCTNRKAISPREGYETDDNYRIRIVNAVRVTNSGTGLALRFAGLGVNGVRDVKIREGAYGLGTAEALIVPEDSTQFDINAVLTELERVRPAGMRLLTREPTYLRVGIQASVIIRRDMDVNRRGTADRAEVAAIRYLNGLLPGNTLVYTRLMQWMLDSSDAIADISISSMQVKGREVLRRNYKPEADEQLIPGAITIIPA